MEQNGKEIKINVWVNEPRLEALKQANLATLAKEKFAGMMVLEIHCTNEQKDRLLRLYPSAKYDPSTTNSIELLPRDAKDRMFEISLKEQSTGPDAVEHFLREIE